MNLPTPYIDKTEWTFVGPMGPALPAHLLSNPVLGVDGGAHFAPELDLWVGDSDSHTGEPRAKHAFKFAAEKDASDFALALSLFKRELPYRLHLWGLLGGRRDHELFNLGEALGFLTHKKGAEIFFYDSEGRVRFHLLGPGQWTIHRMGIFSLGAIAPTPVKLTGACQYPIPRPHTIGPLSSFGLSNKGEGTMTLETQGPVFLYFPEQA